MERWWYVDMWWHMDARVVDIKFTLDGGTNKIIGQ